MNCPHCKSGKMTIKVHQDGKVSSFEMGCITCNGTGVITKEQLKLIEAEKKLWCSCGNPSQVSDFHDDNTSRHCSKHHWTCHDCGKILQVG